jgi:hypothetical protein
MPNAARISDESQRDESKIAQGFNLGIMIWLIFLSPGGTAEAARSSAVPPGLIINTHPSPKVETLGYCQKLPPGQVLNNILVALAKVRLHGRRDACRYEHLCIRRNFC